MRGSLIISLSAHVLLSLIVFNWVSFHEVKYVPRAVYNVTLVAEPVRAEPLKPPPKPQPKVEKPAPEPEPEPEKKEEMAPPENPKPRPTKKKTTAEKPKQKEVPKTIEQSQPDSSLAVDPVETLSETGEMVLDTPDFPFSSYINRIRRKIAANWRVPEGSQGEDRFCRVYFRIQRGGGVSEVAVEETSGLFMFDQAPQRAVLESAPMPPLPPEYRDQYLGVHFSFAYKEKR